MDLRELFIGELGWDHGGADLEVTVAGRTFALEAIAHKRGLVAYRYLADSERRLPGSSRPPENREDGCQERP